MAGPGGREGGGGGKMFGGVPNREKGIVDALATGGATVGKILTTSLGDAAAAWKTMLTSNDIADSIGNAVKSAFDATTIDLNAKMGPITVNLSGGELLKTLSDQLLEKLRGDIAGVVSSIFNNDGSQKTITNTQIPRE